LTRFHVNFAVPLDADVEVVNVVYAGYPMSANEELGTCALPGLADSADADGRFCGDASRYTFGRIRPVR
jgi:hypothetical protein